MNSLFLRNIRFYVFGFSILFSIAIYCLVTFTVLGETLQLIRLTQWYALSALTCLYFTLLAHPFYYCFSWLPFAPVYFKASRSLYISIFYFGLLHALLAFFGQLGGFGGLSYLNIRFLLAISFSFTALVIFSFLTLISFDLVLQKLPVLRWRFFPQLLYIAGIFILIHAFLLGTHFAQLSDVVPQMLFTALVILLFLEVFRVDGWLKKQFIQLPQLSVVGSFLVTVLFLGVSYFLLPISSQEDVSFGIHAQHIQLAKQAQQMTGNTSANQQIIPGMTGDRTRRFTVSFDHPEHIQPNQPVLLSFQVFDASSGNQVQLFQKVYEKLLHLVVVNSDLTYFSHIHPELKENTFVIVTQFPKSGVYHLYLDFQPVGAIEQQFAFTVTVGDVKQPILSHATPDTNLTKVFGNYEVSLQYPTPLYASEMAVGQQQLTFTLRDAKTKKQLTTLQPYLGAFGHLVMIQEKTFDYLHIHPTNLTPPLPDARGGPTVSFLPLGLYGPIKPGVYRLFAQFNPDGKLFTADYTVEIK